MVSIPSIVLVENSVLRSLMLTIRRPPLFIRPWIMTRNMLNAAQKLVARGQASAVRQRPTQDIPAFDTDNAIIATA